MIAIYERTQNIWLRKLLHERERIIMKYRGKYLEEGVLNSIQKRYEKIEGLIEIYGE